MAWDTLWDTVFLFISGPIEGGGLIGEGGLIEMGALILIIHEISNGDYLFEL